MATPLSTVRTKVRDHIDEPSANYWSDVELNRYIGERQLDLWRRILAIKKDYFLAANGTTITLVVGTYIYTLPADFFRATALRVTTSGFQEVICQPLDPSTPMFIAGLNSDVTYFNPYTIYYAIRANNMIWFSPLPQQVLTIRVDYIQLPTEVSADTDTFVIPDAFMNFVEYMASADALAKGPVGNPDYWKSLGDQSWERIMMALDTPRNDQGPDIVRGVFDGAI